MTDMEKKVMVRLVRKSFQKQICMIQIWKYAI